MATPIINAQTGQIIPPNGSTDSSGNAYDKFTQNMTNMLQEAQSIGSKGNTALQGQIGGLERQQAPLGIPGTNNPLNFLYNMAGASSLAGEQNQMSNIYGPGITSIQGQLDAANKNLENLNTTANTEVNAYSTMKNAGIGANTIGQIPGSLSQYSYDSRTGVFTNLSTGSQSSTPPPSTATSKEIDTTHNGMQEYASNYYQSNATPKPEMTPISGVGTKQGDWTYTGTDWQLTPGTATQAAALNSYIKDHSKGSPISGLMIMNAAQNAGVDPWKLAATLANQSDFGTSVDAPKPNQSWTLTVNDIAREMAGTSTPNTGIGQVTKTPAPTNPVDLIAWQVLNNLMSPASAKSSVSGIPSGLIALNNSLARQSNNTYDEGAYQAKYDARTSSIASQTGTVNDLSAARQSVANIANSVINQIATNGQLNPTYFLNT